MKVKKIGTRRQLILLGLLAGILILALVKWGGGGAPAPRPLASAGRPDLAEDKPAASRPRARSAEKTILLKPPRQMNLEQALEYIEDDEYVEITPKCVRLRKTLLKEADRRRYNRQAR